MREEAETRAETRTAQQGSPSRRRWKHASARRPYVQPTHYEAHGTMAVVTLHSK